MLNTLDKNFSRWQIDSIGDYLHEMSNPVFWEKNNLPSAGSQLNCIPLQICKFLIPRLVQRVPLWIGGGWVWQRWQVSYVTGASNWYWLLGSWARPVILLAGKGREGMFLFLLFLHFHSCSSFFPDPLFHLLYYLFYIFSPFLWEMTQNDPQGLTCR